MPRTAFPGRAAELGRLRQALTETRTHGSQVVVVVGEPGIGKTRLLNEFRNASRDVRFLEGKGSPLASTVPFSAVAEAFESVLRPMPPEAVLDLCGGRARDLAAVLPSAAAAVRGAAPSTSRLGIFEGILVLASGLAESQQTVMLLDDFHEADPATWEVISYLGRNPMAAPLLVVVALRSVPLVDEQGLSSTVGNLLKDELAAVIRLAPLTRDDVAALVADVLPGHPRDQELADWLFDRARGNPLFTTGLIAELNRDPEKRVVPVSVREHVRQVVARLDDTATRVVEMAAVLGSSFSIEALAAVLNAELVSGVDELVARDLLAPRDGRPLTFDFVHPVVGEAVYENISPTRRLALHRHVAVALVDAPLAVRAYHMARGATPGDRDAVALLHEAGRDAERRESHREALAHLHAAVGLVRERKSPERLALLDEIAWQAACVADHEAGIPPLRELIASATSPEAEAGARMRLASFLTWGPAEVEEAEREARTAVRLLETANLAAPLPAARNELAWVLGAVGDLDAQIEGSRRAAAEAGALGQEMVALHAEGSLGHALTITGRHHEGAAVLQQSAARARRLGDPAQIEWHTTTWAEALMFGGDLASAEQALSSVGTPLTDMPPSRRAFLEFLLGRWDASLANSRVVQALTPGAPAAHSAWASSLAAVIASAQGDTRSAGAFLGQAGRVYDGRGVYWFSARHDWAAGWVAWIRGDVATAATRLRAAVRRMEEMGATLPLALILPDVVELLVAAGARDEATRLSRRLDEIAVGTGAPLHHAWASFARALTLLASGDRAAARSELVAVLPDLAATPFLLARSHEQLAAIGDPLEHLREAAALYAALPAPVFHERVVAVMRRTGPAGRRRAMGVGPLSAREREVAVLAQRGLTSKAIAAQMHLNERTVESHLAHIYAKLGISGRGELEGVPADRLGPL